MPPPPTPRWGPDTPQDPTCPGLVGQQSHEEAVALLHPCSGKSNHSCQESMSLMNTQHMSRGSASPHGYCGLRFTFGLRLGPISS